MKLNLGCGRKPLPGYVNIDRLSGTGVDLVLDTDESPLPFPAGSVEEVRSSHFLEHVANFGGILDESHRVLRNGGQFVATVPYGFHPSPYHRRFFDRGSMDDLVNGTDGLDVPPGRWRLVRLEIRRSGWWAWHVQKWIHPRFPVGQKSELFFILEKKGAP